MARTVRHQLVELLEERAVRRGGLLTVDFADADSAAGAAGLGARAALVDRLSAFRVAVKGWDCSDGAGAPTVIDVRTDEEVSPVLKFSSPGVGGYE